MAVYKWGCLLLALGGFGGILFLIAQALFSGRADEPMP
jgi:hypothetical protein